MIPRTVLLAAWMLTATACRFHQNAPGRPAANSQVIPPGRIVNFDFLYAKNCAGCHGRDGRGGAAIGIGNPVYLAIADDAAIRRISAEGVPRTAMPAFAQHSGGM